MEDKKTAGAEVKEYVSETDIRIKALEDEFSKTKTETKQLMLDIRALLMEALSPLRSQASGGKTSNQNEEIKR